MVALPAPASPTIDAIYKTYEAKADRKPRSYLGMSQMGTECDRALWYSFRWAGGQEEFDGRKLRLFETGHREEARMLDDLEACGVTIWRVDPATGEQWTVSGVMGHFGGHMDGQGQGFAEAPAARHVLEFKTHNDKSFKELVSKGVAAAKPGHHSQMQLYMHFSGIQRAYYLAHNKNTDELYQERVAYDAVVAGQLVARAERIITSQNPPARLHENPDSKAAWQCKFCPHFNWCHGSKFSQRNCRTCLSSTPVEGGFHCDKFKQVNDAHLQRIGCSRHLYIPALVPGEQIDADPEAHTVTYKLNNGQMWIDGDTGLPGSEWPPEGGGGPPTDDKETDDAVPVRGEALPPVEITVKSSGPADISEEVA